MPALHGRLAPAEAEALKGKGVELARLREQYSAAVGDARPVPRVTNPGPPWPADDPHEHYWGRCPQPPDNRPSVARRSRQQGGRRAVPSKLGRRRRLFGLPGKDRLPPFGR